jgi:hypothetical protein
MNLYLFFISFILSLLFLGGAVHAVEEEEEESLKELISKSLVDTSIAACPTSASLCQGDFTKTCCYVCLSQNLINFVSVTRCTLPGCDCPNLSNKQGACGNC